MGPSVKPFVTFQKKLQKQNNSARILIQLRREMTKFQALSFFWERERQGDKCFSRLDFTESFWTRTRSFPVISVLISSL